MFNSKRIIFLIGLLSIVALTGALMAGPAFAGNGNDGSKTLLCHLNSELDAGDDGFLDSVDTPSTDDVEAGWYLDEVDDKAVRKHMKHGDLVIDGTSVNADNVVNTEENCGARDDGYDYMGDNRDDDDREA